MSCAVCAYGHACGEVGGIVCSGDGFGAWRSGCCIRVWYCGQAGGTDINVMSGDD